MYSSSIQFNNKKVVDISNEVNKLDLSAISPMLRLDPEDKKTFADCFAHFLAHQDAATLDTLVIGFWANDYELSNTQGLSILLDILIAHKDQMPQLKALFIGNISQEESEISWIEMINLSPIISALSLENFRARGNGRFLDTPIDSTTLKKLSLETGGLSATTLKHLTASNLPHLEYLEIWIGDTKYYGDATLKTIQPLLHSEHFPKLRYLGLKNCDYADELATALAADAPILNSVTILDLSLGNLSDIGAKALATSAKIATLDKLDLHHHYIEDNALLEQLKAVVTNIDVSDPQQVDRWEGDEGEEVSRYIFVSE